MGIKRSEFAKLAVGDRVIFDAGNEEPIGGLVSQLYRDGGKRLVWDDGAKGTFYEEEPGSYVDWWLPRVHKHTRKPVRN